jgi:outer membrane protein
MKTMTQPIGRGRTLPRLNPKLLSLALAGAGLALLAGCYNYDSPASFNPNTLQRIARAHVGENPTGEMRPLPTTLESRYLPPATQAASQPSFAPATQPGPGAREVRRMSLRDLVRIAVAHNAEVRVNAYQPAIDQARVVEAEAAYDLKFFAQFQLTNQNDLFPSQTNPFLSPVLGQNTVVFQDMQFQSGFRQDTPTGGKVELRYQADQFNRSGPGSKGITPDPFWTNQITLQVTQPLLQNFGSAANWARIAIARNTQKVSMLDFRLSLEKNLADLEKAYWQLVQAEQEVKIREQLLNASLDTAELLRKRVGTENTTNTEVSQANAAAELRRVDLVRARAQVEDLSDQIKKLLNDPDLPVSTGDLVLPADIPIDQPVHFDASEQIQTALTYRAELSQQQLKIDSAEITIRAAKNNELPKLDATASISGLGVGKEFHDAFHNQGRFDFIDYSAGIQFELPIGNREARAITTRTLLQRQQAIDQYRQLIDQVTLEVKKAQREVETTWNEIRTSRQARIAAEDELRRLDIDQKNRPGTMSPAFIQTKLDAQSRVADTQRREVAAIAGYNVAISDLERAKGTILRYDNVVLEEEPRPFYTPKPYFAPEPRQ